MTIQISVKKCVLYFIFLAIAIYAVIMTTYFFLKEGRLETKKTTTAITTSPQPTFTTSIYDLNIHINRNEHLPEIKPSETLKVIGIEKNMDKYMHELSYDWTNSTDQVPFLKR